MVENVCICRRILALRLATRWILKLISREDGFSDPPRISCEGEDIVA